MTLNVRRISVEQVCTRLSNKNALRSSVLCQRDYIMIQLLRSTGVLPVLFDNPVSELTVA